MRVPSGPGDARHPRGWIVGGALLLGLLVPAAPPHAETFVCGDATQLTRAYQSDPSKVTDPLCYEVPKAQTAAQHDLLRTTPQHYLKVAPVEGVFLAVEKTVDEKAAVDAQMAADQATHQAYLTEIATNDFCNTLDLETITTRGAQLQAQIQADIDAVTNIATAKTALTHLNTKMWAALEKLATCYTALRGARQ